MYVCITCVHDFAVLIYMFYTMQHTFVPLWEETLQQYFEFIYILKMYRSCDIKFVVFWGKNEDLLSFLIKIIFALKYDKLCLLIQFDKFLL